MNAPNLDKLFEEYNILANKATVTNETNNYTKALLELNCLLNVNGTFVCNKGWEFMEDEIDKRREGFRCFLEKYKPIQSILEFIDKNPDNSSNKLASNLNLNNETLCTYLSWLETLNIITLDEHSYIINNNEEEYAQEPYTPLHTSTIDIRPETYSIFEYVRQINRNMINLNPEFQRMFVWKPIQKSKFIESILLNIPLPPIYLKKESDTKFYIVDGLQRTQTICQFMNNKFKLEGLQALPELNGHTFNTIDTVSDGLSARLENRQFLYYVMQPSVPMAVVYDVFDRINTCGTQLSRQEVRNCIYQGKATCLLKEISEDDIFRTSIDYGIKSLRMKDREAILRCIAFALFNHKSYYKGSMDDFLDFTLSQLNKKTQSELDILKAEVLHIYELTNSIFGKYNFRNSYSTYRGRINIAVMETVFEWFFHNSSKIDSSILSKFPDCLKRLISDDVYQFAVRQSTGANSSVNQRFTKVHEYFDKVLTK